MISLHSNHLILKVLSLVILILVFLDLNQVYAQEPAFTTVQFLPNNDTSQAIATGDINGDGVLDIVVGNGGIEGDRGPTDTIIGAQNYIYLSIHDTPGQYTFYALESTDNTQDVALADLNGDGALDLVVGNLNEPNLVYLNPNNGSGKFQSSAKLRAPGGSVDGTTSLALGDLDSNGTIDIVVGNGGAQFLAGSWVFDQGSGRSICKPPSIFADGYLLSINLDFINQLDNTQLNSELRIQFANEGFGLLDDAHIKIEQLGSRWTIISGGTRYKIRKGSDALNVYNEGEANLIYLNRDGSGNFENVSPILFGGIHRTTSIALGNFDNDANDKLDIVEGNGGIYVSCNEIVYTSIAHDPNFLYISKGFVDTNNFNADAIPLPQLTQTIDRHGGILGNLTTSLAVGDLNDDNALDLVVGNGGLKFVNSLISRSGQANQILINRNDNTGSLNTGTSPAGIDGLTTSLALGDINADGYLDILFGNNATTVGNRTQLLLNSADNKGTFHTAIDAGGQYKTFDVAISDINNDNILDALIAHAGTNGILAQTLWQPFQRAVNMDPARICPDQNGNTFNCGYSVDDFAVGDFTGDHLVDIVIGRDGGFSGGGGNTFGARPKFYRNNGSNRFIEDIQDVGIYGTQASVLADLDSDFDLDLILANTGPNGTGQSNVVLINQNGSFTNIPPVNFNDGSTTQNINSSNAAATADLNQDGKIDIIIGNGTTGLGQENVICINTTTVRDSFSSKCAYIQDADVTRYINNTQALAVADFNEDGLLDLVIGNEGDNSLIHIMSQYDREHITFTTIPLSNTNKVQKVVVGDFNGDGYTDVVFGNIGRNSLHINRGDGTGYLNDAIYFGGFGDTESLTSSDINEDGKLDLVEIASDANHIFLNITSTSAHPEFREVLLDTAFIDDTGNDLVKLSTLADFDNNGSFDLVTGNIFGNLPNYLYPSSHFYNQSTNVYVNRPIKTAIAPGYSSPLRITGVPQIEIVTNQPQGIDLSRQISGLYSYIGGGNWISAKPANIINLGTDKYVFDWDINESSFFGQSDNVVFRTLFFAQPPQKNPTPPNTFHYPNVVAGPYQWAQISATTYPFSVRGNQIRVFKDESKEGNQVSKAIVMRREGTEIAELMPNPDLPLATTSDGYLPGRGIIQKGDELVALWPVTNTELITFTNKYSLFLTSAVPTVEGLKFTPVITRGVVPLTVTTENYLLLFDLDVSLEWDASNDTDYQSRLIQDLHKVSRILYDWTDGQVALGDVRIHFDRNYWDEADVRVYASNKVRPNATHGGVISVEKFVDPGNPEFSYEQGKVRIGATWNRYGNSIGELGEDWPRALAHELGHYLLFLSDNYIGLDNNNRFVAIDDCHGAMFNPYLESESEFYPTPINKTDKINWEQECADSFSDIIGRSDWETITTIYSFLKSPPEENFGSPANNSGPSGLPIAVTNVVTIPLEVNSSSPLISPIFNLTTQPSDINISSRARTFLFQDDTTGKRIVDLGRPIAGEVLARGARVGDRLCVFDYGREEPLIGCNTVAATPQNTVQNPLLELTIVPGWKPFVTITPGGVNIVSISVEGAEDGLTMCARVYPEVGGSTDLQKLDLVNGKYNTIFTFSGIDVEAAHIHIWVVEHPADPSKCEEPNQDTRHELVTQYALGGGPGLENAISKDFGAPLVEPGGETILVGDTTVQNLKEGDFYAIQSIPYVSKSESWLTVIGEAKRVLKSKEELNLSNFNLVFNYFERDVPDGQEHRLAIYKYKYDPEQAIWYWDRLPDIGQNLFWNYVSAPIDSEGLYALMVTIDTPGLYSGWNHFAYPDTNRRPVNTAIESIAKDYMTIAKQVTKGEDGNPVPAQWRLYDPRVALEHPEFATLVNDLQTMQPLESYWVYVVTDTVPYIGVPVADDTQQLRASGVTELPPATFYGRVLPTEGFDPQPGNEIVAVIDHGGDTSICGRSVVLDSGPDPEYYVDLPHKLYLPIVGGSQVASKLYYKIQVRADTGEGCGVFGHDVTFYVNGQKLESNHPWGNSQACFHDLRLAREQPKPGEPLTDCFKAPAPDLIVNNVTVLENDLRVVIKNAGTAEVPAGAGFWVDAYINPDPNHLPSKVNDIWQDFTSRGIAWGLVDLSEPIDPGGTLTLTVGSPYFMAEYSDIRGGWSAGTTIYVQVDSAHALTNYGSVLESHEILGEPYNNIWSPPNAPMLTAAAIAQGNVIDPGEGLPPRR